MFDISLIDNYIMSSINFQIQSVACNDFDDNSELFSQGHVNGMLDILLDLGLISELEHLSYLQKFDNEIYKRRREYR